MIRWLVFSFGFGVVVGGLVELVVTREELDLRQGVIHLCVKELLSCSESCDYQLNISEEMHEL